EGGRRRRIEARLVGIQDREIAGIAAAQSFLAVKEIRGAAEVNVPGCVDRNASALGNRIAGTASTEVGGIGNAQRADAGGIHLSHKELDARARRRKLLIRR